ncbi:hypothetical protein [Parabacteroides pacaensis]|uniref:hypothetical protein n=1 Tax=Parabacteroides pacaensis TaxID=2086575 RepID=UPI00131EBF9E|nr:hypothetical protein [Parabacteroides pacaensis]
MKKKIIGLLFISCVFFSCENEEMVGSKDMPENELPVTVNFDLSLKGGLDMETEYLPMTRSTTDNIKTILNTGFYHKYVLLKNIEGAWYVDKIQSFKITGETMNIGGVRTSVVVRQNGIFANLAMELRPGTYQLVVFLNADALDWKTDNIQEGDLVFKEGDPSTSYPRICTYKMNTTHAPEAIFLGWEIFTGMTNFTVGKNGDVHTATPDRNIEVPLTRKVAEFQLLCKGDPESEYYAFITTAYSLTANFLAKNGDRFCEGLNVLGQAYYNEDTPLTKIGYYCNTYSLKKRWRTDNAGRIYQMPEVNSTDFSIFFLADPENTQGVACEIEVVSLTGQSGERPFNGFQYEGGLVDRVLKANELIGVAFECKRVESDPAIVQLATDNAGNELSPENYLLSPDYMWNQDKYVK